MNKKLKEPSKNKHPNLKKYSIEFFLGLLVGIIAAVLFAIFSNSYDALQQQAEKRNLINSLAIGTNREYIEDVIGVPYIKCDNTQNGFIDYIYKIDGALLRIIYSEDSAKAIFLTILNPAYIGKYDNNEVTFLFNDKDLGNFTFEDIEFRNEGNYDQYTNGAGLTFYIESFWTRPSGNYHEYVLAIMPYGLFIPPEKIDELQVDKSHYNTHFGYMGNFYPNTYGIIDDECLDKITEMLIDIDSFDYLSMRNFDYNMEEYIENNEIDDYEIEDIESK